MGIDDGCSVAPGVGCRVRKTVGDIVVVDVVTVDVSKVVVGSFSQYIPQKPFRQRHRTREDNSSPEPLLKSPQLCSSLVSTDSDGSCTESISLDENRGLVCTLSLERRWLNQLLAEV